MSAPQRATLTTSNVAKYQLHTQVHGVGDGSTEGWWVVGVAAENGRGSGPGLVTLSSVRGGGTVFLQDMDTVDLSLGQARELLAEAAAQAPQQRLFLDDAPTVTLSLEQARALSQQILLASDSDDEEDDTHKKKLAEWEQKLAEKESGLKQKEQGLKKQEKGLKEQWTHEHDGGRLLRSLAGRLTRAGTCPCAR